MAFRIPSLAAVRKGLADALVLGIHPDGLTRRLLTIVGVAMTGFSGLSPQSLWLKSGCIQAAGR